MENRRYLISGDILIAIGVILIIIIMLIPLKPFVIDYLVICNFSFTLLILFISIYIFNPLQFSVFPSLLLLLTLFDLALNIAMTRLILLQGEAGDIVHSFGEFVVGGNIVVGFVVFLIIMVVQFIVITKGSERVAEVSARFTLDAMPGKQMSIDADLSAGLISNEEARIRRREVEDEADFYGAMDGASKFIKGNVIAAIIIVFINIIGGITMGYLKGQNSLTEIVRLYLILTIGEGLVSQIPALFVSVSMGIIVTRAASKSDLGTDLIYQISTQPKALKNIVAFLYFLSFIGIFTRLPFLPFFVLAVFLNFIILKNKKSIETTKENFSTKEKKEDNKQSILYNIVKTYPIEINIGYGLLSLIDESKKGNLLQRLKAVRENLSNEFGFLLPTIRIKDISTLGANEYLIKIKGNEVANGEIMIGHYLAMKSSIDSNENLNGFKTKEPTFGLDAIWIIEDEKDKAERLGYTVVDAVSVLATHLTEIIRNNVHEIFSRKEMLQIFDIIKAENPSLVDDLIPNILQISDVEIIFKNLLKEKIPLLDIETILETLISNGRKIKDLNILTELVREAIPKTISAQFKDRKNHLTVMALDPHIEKIIYENIKETENNYVYNLEPELLQKIYKAISEGIEKLLQHSPIPLIVCSPNVRMHLKKLTEKVIPQMNIISYNEIDSLYSVDSLGVISLEGMNLNTEKNS